MDLGLRGRTAIVCAASMGLGRACATVLGSEGVKLFIVARRREIVERTAGEIQSATGAETTAVTADVSTQEGRDAILAACPDPDILINNAGGPTAGDFRKWGKSDWDKALATNMLAPIELIRATIDGMIARKFGRVINITSHLVKAPAGLFTLSNTARSGLTGFSGGISRDVVQHNVTINNILPGTFDTDRLRSNLQSVATSANRTLEDVVHETLSTNPARRLGRPEELGALCAFLCSAHAGYITGQNLLIDGGVYPGNF